MKDIKKYLHPLIILIVFEAVAVTLWLTKDNLFYLLNFSYIGLSISFGIFLFIKKYRHARRIVQLLVGLYMLVFLGLHYAVAKIFGPLVFGRGWCGYACWTAMVLDFLPYKIPQQPRRKIGWIRYITFVASLIFVAALFLAIAGISIGVMIFVNKSSEETLLAQTEQQAGKLADQVALHHFRIQSSENTLDANINESAFLAGGRILIIDQNYRIQKDTFSFQQDAYIISEDVMSVMSGEVDKISRIRNKYAKVILPIKDEGDSIIGVIVATASTNAIDQTYHSMLKSTIQLGLIIVPLVFIAVLIVSWLTVRGLREMNRKIAYISEGNLEAQLPVKGFRETRYLARNYNSVISKLADIDTTRQEFVSDVSHELKTPITSMKVLAESLLQNENADTAAYQEYNALYHAVFDGYEGE